MCCNNLSCCETRFRLLCRWYLLHSSLTSLSDSVSYITLLFSERRIVCEISFSKINTTTNSSLSSFGSVVLHTLICTYWWCYSFMLHTLVFTEALPPRYWWCAPMYWTRASTQPYALLCTAPGVHQTRSAYLKQDKNSTDACTDDMPHL